MRDAYVLRFRDMGLRQKGGWTRRFVHLVLSIALRLFFRRIEIGGARNIPPDEPLVFVSNHPNGLIDPALIFCALPRRISFLAKSTLFRIPVISFLVNAVESLPLYRRVDTAEDLTKNRLTFERCHALLRLNRCIALFPEGVSHNATRLLPVKTGAARIALGALSVEPSATGGRALDCLKIVPVGLYYTSKTSFRSEALIRFGAPIEVRPVKLDAQGEPPRESVRELSARIEEALLEVTLNVEDDEELGVVTKAQELFSSLYEGLSLRQTLSTEFDLRRRIAEKMSPAAAGVMGEGQDELRRRILKHEEELGALGINAENLSLLTHTRWNVFRHFLLRGALLLLLLPLSIPGALLHLPAFLICVLLSRFYRRHGVDEIAPTVKILAAIALMPLTWLVVAALCYVWWGWRVALPALPASIACGYAAMRSLETLYDMRGWFKGVLLLVNNRRRVLRLFLERRALHQEMVKFVEAAPE
ncbi:MAG: glycerol-3-phosphate O-acyltransferase / dihydroxyacetone phosphate acyltransferase [Pyrinomonadaceae bacterium]|nr:glycerol-3-phosphate O-acyltransferase / dihydroxyacetone phosphate acyltransferase [Pyrinomonadaceae bacterium]